MEKLEKAETKLNPEVYEESIFDYYKSLSPSHREEEEDIIVKCIESGVVPDLLRYGIFKDVYRGVARNSSGNLFYFNYTPSSKFKLIKASDESKVWEANRILNKSTLGCDLIKSENKNKEDLKHLDEKEDEEKAGLTTGGAASDVIPEEQNVAAQDHLTTDVHPGAAEGSTPDNNAGNWHGQQEDANKAWTYTDLLKGLGMELQANPIGGNRIPTQKEQEFMVEALGKTPEEAASGEAQLTSMQRALFQQWLKRSLNTKVNSLKDWLGKTSG